MTFVFCKINRKAIFSSVYWLSVDLYLFDHLGVCVCECIFCNMYFACMHNACRKWKLDNKKWKSKNMVWKINKPLNYFRTKLGRSFLSFYTISDLFGHLREKDEWAALWVIYINHRLKEIYNTANISTYIMASFYKSP